MSGFEILTAMPARVTSGDTLSIALADLSASYPVETYRLAVIVKAGATDARTITLTAAGGRHSGTLSFAGIPAGSCRYAIKATRLSDDAVRTVESGPLLVLPDPASQDVRSHAEKVLDALEALIEGKAASDVASYAIAGRSLTRMSPDELIKWRSHYRNEVAIQRAAGKPNGGRRITLARFV